ncbi:hypothetical protein SAMN05216353_12822 [Halobacillus alkaliphilus]|uniref:Uncharacterized protein n=1 Tax=Halobacillus alkaliphilus TaxID=396056 RepID=A0A1I2Q6I5_9BACI|nr:hypothetical protein SAMN05216353_12822 [Halobacillus alkaliphilus]
MWIIAAIEAFEGDNTSLSPIERVRSLFHHRVAKETRRLPREKELGETPQGVLTTEEAYGKKEDRLISPRPMATSIDPTSCRAAGKRVVSVASPSLYEQRTLDILKLSLKVYGPIV